MLEPQSQGLEIGHASRGDESNDASTRLSATTRRPPFSSLPLRPSDPPYSAWNLYGPEDELGTLNLLTPASTLAATQEVITGTTIPLNLPLHLPHLPMNQARRPMEHRFIAKGHANDDEVTLNTQSSSQWDGLRHYPYQSLGSLEEPVFYNGVRQPDFVDDEGRCTEKLGVQNLARKGIVGRGVLLDWADWAQRRSMKWDPFSRHSLPLRELKAVAEEQGVEFREADILLIRTGWTAAYLALSEQARIDLAARPQRSFIGVEASEEMFRWHWECGFAAVASDTNAYEAQPFTTSANAAGVSCHEVFLSGWGMPVGELWDLEQLAKACNARGKWTFMLSSCPLDVVGGVGSPANAVAIL